MTSILRHQLRPAISLLIALTLVTGVAYPLAVWAVAQVGFSSQANGSLITVDGKAVGSTLIGQAFSDPKYLWGRLSAAGADGYDGMSSAGSNLGPTNANLIDRVTSDLATWQAANGDAPVPVDLLTTSGSGLDPDVSQAGAEYQVARIAAARGMSADDVRAVIARHTEQPTLGFLGQPRVHVLEVNLDLDGLLP
jgi:potassium-transporting ATPase KdpC subunit